MTISGGGKVTISNSNGYTGGTILTSGEVVVNNNSSTGSGKLTISGGSLDSTIGSVTLAGITQSWSGSFTFVGSSPLNLGTGAVTVSASPTINVNASTLTVGGAITGARGLDQKRRRHARAGRQQQLHGRHALRQRRAGAQQRDSALGSGTLTINGGALDSTVSGVTLANNAERWNAGFAFNGTQSLNLVPAQ